MGKLKNVVSGLLVSFGIASSASALSCPTIDPLADHSGDPTLKLVEGRITYFDHFAYLRSSIAAEIDPDRVWTGRAIIEGIDVRTKETFLSEVVVRRSCVSVWCGGSQETDHALFILRVRSDAFELDLHPCGGKIFPTRDSEK